MGDIKRVIWIDENVDSNENKIFLEIFEGGIKNAKFYLKKSVKEAFDLIKNHRETIMGNRSVKIFHFRLFYVIVSGSLSNDFFTEYVKTTRELGIISANIIFCSNEDKHKRNAYYLDKFLNSGKVYNEKSIDKLIEYINKDECPFLNELQESKQIYKPEKESYGNVFFPVHSISDITFPYFFGQLINSTLVSKYDLEGFQQYLLTFYPELKDLIFPSKEKKIDIPYYLLEKFYLRLYTNESSNFYKIINLDLSNDKFDIYRVYIFLLYDALNKKSIKSFYNEKLYRGTVISKKELEYIQKLFKINEEFRLMNGKVKNKDEINTYLYFSKTFLSFSKDINVAKGFIGNETEDLFPVLFEVEGLKEKEVKKDDFFVPNLDLQNITDFDGELEVLFLPFSCFEIISINDEIIDSFEGKMKVKIIKLRYLYKYRKQLFNYIEKIKNDKEKLQIFIKNVINSTFSEEITNLVNFDKKEKLCNLITNKFKVEFNFANFNIIQCFKNNAKLSANVALNNLMPEVPTCIQKILIEGKEALLIKLENGMNIILRQYSKPPKITYQYMDSGKCKDYPCHGDPINLNYVKNGDIAHKLAKSNNECLAGENGNCMDNCLKKVKHKEQKLKVQNNNYFEFYSLGFAIGDFIANYEKIKNESLMVKLQSLGASSISALVPFLPRILSSFLPQAIVTKVPIVMASLSAFEFILSVKDIIKDKSLTKSETFYFIAKKAGILLGQMALTYAIGQIGFKLLVFLDLSPGKIISIAIGIGIAAGFIIHKIFTEKDEIKELALFSDSLYYQYIPRKFREYCIPTLYWKGTSKKCKSFAIELIEDGYRKWLVINIKKWIRRIDNDNYLDIGNHIVTYKGISENPHKITFILYELKKEEFKPEDWGVGEKVNKDYCEKLSKYFIQVAYLDVF